MQMTNCASMWSKYFVIGYKRNNLYSLLKYMCSQGNKCVAYMHIQIKFSARFILEKAFHHFCNRCFTIMFSLPSATSVLKMVTFTLHKESTRH